MGYFARTICGSKLVTAEGGVVAMGNQSLAGSLTLADSLEGVALKDLRCPNDTGDTCQNHNDENPGRSLQPALVLGGFPFPRLQDERCEKQERRQARQDDERRCFTAVAFA